MLAARPRKDDEELSAVARHLAAQRRALLAEDHDGEQGREPDDGLDRLNAVIGVVMGLHFPLGPPPWAELVAARGLLAEIVGEKGAAPA